MNEQRWRVITNEYNDGKRFHNVVVGTVADIVKWFPEIHPRFFENFNVEKMEFCFENKGNISIWTFHRVTDGS